ncbi:glycosyltransferase [Shivajiella indica]|uniref:Glycosyltransferase n=1 Tax=Shivajiella indica TaxID=872115 RepID=A0ABW5BEJ2_9BACT
MEILAIIIVSILVFQDFLLWIFLIYRFKDYSGILPENLPKVSVFLPCRNEEQNLQECLNALGKIKYPREKIQFILGDDRSADQTGRILEDWVKKNTRSEFVKVIEGDPSKMNGKANALSQMVKLASGDFYLFTDADCIVPPYWVQGMVAASIQEDAGLVTGITSVRGKNLFSRMQSMDWWLTLGMVKVMDDFGSSVTSMGNNMLITKAAYESVGGFEGVPFSLTEDFEIAKSIQKKGYKNIHFVSEINLVHTKGQAGFFELLNQRKRWMSGAMGLSAFWKVLLALQVLFFPFIIHLCFLHPLEGFSIWSIKVITQGLFLYSFASKTGVKLKIGDLILFEIYYLIISWSTIVYYFWPSKTVWKGRRY